MTDMTQDHLSERQTEGLRRRTLSPAELQQASEHLSACVFCQDRVLSGSDFSERVARLERTFERHLTEDELIACVKTTAANPGFVGTHLEACSTCADELRELRAFSTKVRRAAFLNRMPAWGGVLAACLLVATLSWMWTFRPSLTPTPPSSTVARPPEPATIPQTVERAAVLDTLLRNDDALMDSSTARVFRAISPVGIVTASDRPTFRWQPVPGASEYEVSIFDDNFRRVAQSPKVAAAEWRPETPLRRGERFAWQVIARVGAREEKLPTPPARDAVFQVMSEEEAKSIEVVSPLDRALAYAKAGALEDAEREIGEVLEANPESPELTALLKNLRQLRSVQSGIP